MKLADIKRSYLYEGLDNSSKKSMMLWESAGRVIAEAQLTPQQITQLFQQVEKDATAAGGNRTLLGKGKDVAGAVNQAYQNLKGQVENSATMQYFDQKYEEAAAKLKQATGGDAGVMKYVQKYRDFAKKHPIAQSLIYGALIAAAGISGAGAGGAAALGLLKMTDKLLQGEKFSKAAIAGAETGALAYGASKLGDLVKNTFDPVSQTREISWETTGGGISQANIGPGGNVVGDVMLNGQTFTPGSPGYAEAAKELVATAKADGLLGGFGDAADAAKTAARKAMAGSTFESVKLSNDQVTQLFETIVIEAGLWSKFSTQVLGEPEEIKQTAQYAKDVTKQAASWVGKQAQRIGTNLTTKITADKLQKAWKSSGSPTDSEALQRFLVAQGVDAGIVTNALKSISIPATSSRLPDITKMSREQLEQLLAMLEQPTSAPAAQQPATAEQPSMTQLLKQRQAQGLGAYEAVEFTNLKTQLQEALKR